MRSRIGAVLMTVLLALALSFGMGSGARAAESVKFQMDWLFGGKHIAFFVAREKGHFKKNGLDVKILKGRGSLKSAIFVDTKQTEYSYGDFPTALKVIAKGGKTRAIGVGIVFQAGGFIFLDGTNIKTPKDLEGKRYGTTPTDFGTVLLPAMGAASGFDHTKIIYKIMKPAVRTPALFERKIDFISGARGSSLPRMGIIAKRRGRKAHYLFFKDMGISTYGHVLQTHQDRIRSNPDQVGRFVGAVYEAWAWAIKNPKAALEVYMKANREKDREYSWVQIEQGLSDVQDLETKDKGLGYMKESLIKKSVAIANKYFKLSPPVDYKVTYTNQFIRKTPGM